MLVLKHIKKQKNDSDIIIMTTIPIPKTDKDKIKISITKKTTPVKETFKDEVVNGLKALNPLKPALKQVKITKITKVKPQKEAETEGNEYERHSSISNSTLNSTLNSNSNLTSANLSICDIRDKTYLRQVYGIDMLVSFDNRHIYDLDYKYVGCVVDSKTIHWKV